MQFLHATNCLLRFTLRNSAEVRAWQSALVDTRLARANSTKCVATHKAIAIASRSRTPEELEEVDGYFC